MAESRGRVSGPSGAAAKLGIPRSTLDSKIRSLKMPSLAGAERGPDRPAAGFLIGVIIAFEIGLVAYRFDAQRECWDLYLTQAEFPKSFSSSTVVDRRWIRGSY